MTDKFAKKKGMRLSKDSLIKGTLILALAAFVARFLGMIVRIPLLHMLGNEGMAAFVIANNIYLVLLLVATAGIPSALSKLISERLALGLEQEAREIYRAALTFSVTAGMVITILLFGAAPTYARAIGNPDSALAIRALAPALLVFPTIAIMRGYFQGHQNMTAGAMSQIYEQFVRVGGAIVLAWMILQMGYGTKEAAAAASFGGVLGSLAAFIVMLVYSRKLNRSKESARTSVSPPVSGPDSAQGSKAGWLSIYKNLFRLSVPIAVFSMAVPLVHAIDSSTVIPLLEGHIGLTRATEMLGLLGGKAQPIAGIPPILATALSMSIVPIVSSAFAKGDMNEVEAKASQTLRISVLSGLPLVLILVVAARPVNGFLFPDLQGTDLIMWMTLASMFQIMMATSGAILMGIGKTTLPMTNAMVGIAAKLAGSFALAAVFGIYGILLSTIACFAIAMWLNLRLLKKRVQYRILGRNWWPVLGAASATAIIGILVEIGLYHANLMIFSGVTKFGFAFNAAFVACTVLAVYVVVLWKAGVVTANDIRVLPAPLQKVLSRFEIKTRP